MEMLTLKLGIIFAVVLKSTDNTFQKHILENPVFRLVGILKSTSNKSIFKVGDYESISKKHLPGENTGPFSDW